jgi:hypothetical protein
MSVTVNFISIFKFLNHAIVSVSIWILELLRPGASVEREKTEVVA